MARTVRITHYGRALYLYLEDPSISRATLGPKGNYIRASYDSGSKRVQHEGAIRGYGTDMGNALLQQLLSIADRVATQRAIGSASGPTSEQPLGTVPLG
ncbi:MAG: hypothetical protein JWM86_40 [Thermoleophilia bacterium]|nr:hypothetical protein [Thermoleophilia bacterium]